MRLYRLLLRLFPASFRAEYGPEMIAIFARRRAAAPAWSERLLLWLETVLEVIGDAAQLHWDILKLDLRFAFRTLAQSRGFTLTAVMVMALGIGANTAVFSLADHALIRPLPFADSERLVKLWGNVPGYTRTELSPANYRDWKRMSTSFGQMAAYVPASANLVGRGQPLRVEGTLVSAGLLPLLGVEPRLGRRFAAEDDRAGAAGTLLISDRLWRGWFGADPGILGRTVLLDGTPHEVIGVMAPEFSFPAVESDFWTPFRFGPDDYEDRGNNYLKVIAKLRSASSIEQARAEMRLITTRLEREHPENAKLGANVIRLRDEFSRQARLLLIALVGAAACVLLIACTNLVNLLLARALARRQELAVRAALGAGRERLIRQLMTESAVLAALGGVLGVAIANVILPLLVQLVPEGLPVARGPAIDLRVLAFTAVLVAATGLVLGLAPALRGGRPADPSTLREGARVDSDPRRERLRSNLVVAEVCVSLVLLVAAGLLLRALWRIQRIDPGFRDHGVLTLRTVLPLPKYESVPSRERFYEQVLERIRRLPGVTQAAYISFLPLVMTGGIWEVILPGRPEEPTEPHSASLRFVTPGFFETLGIPLRLGRDLDEADTQDRPYVAVVSESMVRRYWPRQNPLGRRFTFGLQERTVVGVVGDIRVRGLERDSEPQVYLPYRQVPDGGLIGYRPQDLAIRASVDPLTLLPAVRRIIHQADSEQPISDVRLLAEIVAAETTPRRVQLRVIGAFAAVALILAAIGIHGLLSFAVSMRAREIGIRLALGARAGNIVGLVLGQGARLVAAGLTLGLMLAYGAGRALRALLADVDPVDLPALACAVGLIGLMALVGSAAPALRALRVDPASVIRSE